jgi:hypothetical protein
MLQYYVCVAYYNTWLVDYFSLEKSSLPLYREKKGNTKQTASVTFIQWYCFHTRITYKLDKGNNIKPFPTHWLVMLWFERSGWRSLQNWYYSTRTACTQILELTRSTYMCQFRLIWQCTIIFQTFVCIPGRSVVPPDLPGKSPDPAGKHGKFPTGVLLPRGCSMTISRLINSWQNTNARQLMNGDCRKGSAGKLPALETLLNFPILTFDIDPPSSPAIPMLTSMMHAQ